MCMHLCVYLTMIVCMYNSVGVVVARVRMTSITKVVYAAALQGVFECCQQDNKTSILDTLKGVIVDWATAQIEGLKAVVGEERAEQLLRGCQVVL